MEALAAQGNTAEALQAYDAVRCLLRDELGTAPGADLQALHQRLLGPAVGRGREPEARGRRLAKVGEGSGGERPGGSTPP
jgi:DNA-binding SARP family transcriptional activator